MATKGRFQVKWYGAELMKDMSRVTRVEEKAAAQRIIQRMKKKVPVAGGQHSVTKARTRGSSGAFGRQWKTRKPGRLKRSIRMSKSRFKRGGYLAWVGGYLPYYAFWVERGTIFTSKQKFGRKGEQFMKKSASLETARFIRNMRKRLGV